MKKSVINKLVLLGMAISLLLSGCSSDGSKASASSNKDYTIGIVQLAEHPALDDARRGFEDGLKELGVDVEIVYQ